MTLPCLAPPPAAVADGSRAANEGVGHFVSVSCGPRWWPLGWKSERFLPPFSCLFFPPFILSVERSYGSQEEEAAEAVVLISFIALKSRPSGGAGWWWLGLGGLALAWGRACLRSRPRGGRLGGRGRIWECFAENEFPRERGSGSWGSGDSVTQEVLALVRALTQPLGGGLDPSTKDSVP